VFVFVYVFVFVQKPLFSSIQVTLATPEELAAQAECKRTCGTAESQPLGLTVSRERLVRVEVASPDSPARRPKLRVAKDTTGRVVTRSQHIKDGVEHTKDSFIKEIMVMKGLPRVRMASVLAHELCHAFMSLYRVPITTPQHVEGLCELWSYQFLKRRQVKLGCDEAARWMHLIESAEDGVYGEGFRLVHASFEAFCTKQETPGRSAVVSGSGAGQPAASDASKPCGKPKLGRVDESMLLKFVRALHRSGTKLLRGKS